MEKAKKGFTLTELLVVISLTGILSAVGLASYISFNRRETVIQSSRKIVQDLRLAQSLAINNQKPADCGDEDILKGYIFKINQGGSYQILAECTNHDPFTVKTDSIPSNLALSGFSQIKFKVLRGGIEFSGGQSLTISGFNQVNVITVGSGGEITLSTGAQITPTPTEVP